MRKRMLAVLFLLLAAPPEAPAMAFSPPDLPAAEQVQQALAQSPLWAAARDQQGVAHYEAQELASGPYEFSVQVQGQSRWVRGMGDYGEWWTTLQRPVRLPGKAALDRQIGAAGEGVARAGLAEARLGLAHVLLGSWLDWLGGVERERLLVEQQRLAAENLAAVKKRVQAGDAARMDLQAAEADVADVTRNVLEARTRKDMALAVLNGRFPAVGTQSPPPLSDPQPPPGPLGDLRQAVLTDNPRLQVLERAVARARVTAARARAERWPDPTLAVFVASERGGDERIWGGMITMPIPGPRRGQEQARTQALLRVAEDHLAAGRQMLVAQVASQMQAVEGNHAAFLAAQRAAAAMTGQAQMMQRAYALGEVDLQRLLLARRQARMAAVAALEARLAALQATYGLLLDAHILWDEGSGASGLVGR
ncbi:MAG: TolC family protein [Acidithiobacillus sp.]